MELTRLISGALMPECCTNIFARERWLPDEASGICCAQISQRTAQAPTHSVPESGQNQLECLAAESTHIRLQPGEGRGQEREGSHMASSETLPGVFLFSSLVKLSLQCIYYKS